MCYDDVNEILYFYNESNQTVRFMNVNDLLPIESLRMELIYGFVNKYRRNNDLIILHPVIDLIALFCPGLDA